MKQDLPYRRGVNALIVGKNNRFLLIQLQEYDDCEWKLVGGGIEENESAVDAVFREIEGGVTGFSRSVQ